MVSSMNLNRIDHQVSICTLCPLHQTRTHTVPGTGSAKSGILFVGEAPGRNEDLQGVPFCGAAGNLLGKLLAEINLSRDSVFITNMVKCRPPGNRDPLPEELAACQPFLEAQIEQLNPTIIITLGRFAMNYFLPQAYISQVHGKLFNLTLFGRPRKLIPLYHPAAAFRRGEIMTQLRADFAKLPSYLINKQSTEKEHISVKSNPPAKQMGLDI